jgi:6-phosphogluconolactonase
MDYNEAMHRTHVAQLLVLIALSMTTFQAAQAAGADASPGAHGDVSVYVGTYTKTAGEGINFFHFDPATGRATQPSVVAKMRNPSFLARNPTRPVLYAISEVDEHGGEKTGSAAAFAIDAKTGRLTLLNEQSSGGPGPCYVSVDHSGRVLLVANYGGGSVASLPIEDDGRLKPPACVDRHHGSSVNRQRQTGPFAHCFDADPANRFALAADLGTDKVMLYRLDAEKGTFKPNELPFVQVTSGAGPRHLAFHPNGKFVYLINELNSTISLFPYDAARGMLPAVQEISTLPAGFHGASTTAEIAVHPSGRFVYGSNRGHDSIAMFAVHPGTGTLKSLGHQSTHGKTPRHFAIDPTGKYLLAANQDSNNVVIFRIDGQTGLLAPTGQEVSVPMPVCLVMAPANGR